MKVAPRPSPKFLLVDAASKSNSAEMQMPKCLMEVGQTCGIHSCFTLCVCVCRLVRGEHNSTQLNSTQRAIASCVTLSLLLGRLSMSSMPD